MHTYSLDSLVGYYPYIHFACHLLEPLPEEEPPALAKQSVSLQYTGEEEAGLFLTCCYSLSVW